MDKKGKVWALVLTYVGGLILFATLLAGFLPLLYRVGLVYYGFGWYKAGIAAAGLLIGVYGLYSNFRKSNKK
jgi:hypothetical protein